MSGWWNPARLTGMALPMAVWALHFVVVYIVQGTVCARVGAAMAHAEAGRATSWWLLALTLFALAAIGLLGARAWRAWRGLDRAMAEMRPIVDAPLRQHRFMAATTAWLALLALLAVVFTALPILILPPCA